MNAAASKGSLGSTQLFNLAFGVAIGIGWITVMGTWLGAAGPLGSTIAFILAAIAMLSVAQCYAAVAVDYPIAGGEVAYAKEVFGRRTAFWVGWFLALTYIVVVAFELVSLAWILQELFPQISARIGDGRMVDLLTAVVGLLCVLSINLMGTMAAARFQSLLVNLKIIISIGLIVAGVWFGSTSNIQPLLGDHPGGSSLSGIFVVLAMAPFFFAGFGVVAQAMADVHSPETIRRMPWIMGAVILGTMAFYVLIIWAVSLGAPREQILGSSLPAASAFSVAFGSDWGAKLVLILGLLGLFTILNGIFFAAIRIIQVLAKLGFVPMIFDREYAGTRIAPASALFVAAGAFGLAALGREIIPVLVNVASMSLSAVMAFVCFVLFYKRRTAGAPFRALIVPAIGTLLAAAMALLPLYSALESASGFPPQEWLAIIAWVLIGAVSLLVIRYLPNHYHAADGHVFLSLRDRDAVTEGCDG